MSLKREQASVKWSHLSLKLILQLKEVQWLEWILESQNLTRIHQVFTGETNTFVFRLMIVSSVRTGPQQKHIHQTEEYPHVCAENVKVNGLVAVFQCHSWHSEHSSDGQRTSSECVRECVCVCECEWVCMWVRERERANATQNTLTLQRRDTLVSLRYYHTLYSYFNPFVYLNFLVFRSSFCYFSPWCWTNKKIWGLFLDKSCGPARCFPPVWREGSVSGLLWTVAGVLLWCFGWLVNCQHPYL